MLTKISLVIGISLCAGLAAAEDFTVIVLPDTQNYSQDYPELFHAQTQWIVDQQTARNIVFVAHLGDLTNIGNNPDEMYQWVNARAAMDRLDAGGVPYGTCLGNHDIYGTSTGGWPDGAGYDPNGTNYVAYFGPQHYAGYPWYGGASPSGLSNYEVVTADGRALLFLHLCVETPAAELAWAQTVLNANRDKPTLVSTHRYLYDWGLYGSGRYSAWEYTVEPSYRHDGIQAGDYFNNFIAPNRQIYLAYCGHCDGEYRQTSMNQYGLPVHEVLADFQDSYGMGGNGYLRILNYHPDQQRIDTETYSPSLNGWLTGGESQFALDVNLDAYASAGPALRFQSGVGGYAGTQDTWIGEYDDNTSHGGESLLIVDDDTENSWWDDYVGQGLVRFDNLFRGPVYEGEPMPTRIPVGATIQRASITINLDYDTDLWDPAFYCHRMWRSWDEASTWNSLSGGIVPGDDCDPTWFAVFHGDNDPDLEYHRTFDATAIVQTWTNGVPNYGFAILPERDGDLPRGDGDDPRVFDEGITIVSSEHGSTTLRPALDVEFTYAVINVPPTVTAALCANDPPNPCGTAITVNEGRQIELTMSAADPNPLDPLVWLVNGLEVGYATGQGTLHYWIVMPDEGTYPFAGAVRDDEATVGAGQAVVTVLNVAPTITSLTPNLTVSVNEQFNFAATASDPGVLDVLTFNWDLDGDGAYDDFTGPAGMWSYTTPGDRIVRVRVSDGDGGFAYGQFSVQVLASGTPGDLNCDGVVNFDDINPFVLALTDPAGYAAAFPNCNYLNGDINNDGVVTFDDINGFVALLGG